MIAVELVFSRDEETAAMLRLSTRQADAGDWDAAIATLYVARDRMMSSVGHPAATWCKLPLYLSRAGRFDEAEQAFDWLLADLPRRARKDSFMDDPSVSFGKSTSKRKIFNLIVRATKKVIDQKRAVAQRRRLTRPASPA